MPKELLTWPDNPLDQVVKTWMDAKGIKDTDVMHYKIDRLVSGFCTIELTMHFNPKTEE